MNEDLERLAPRIRPIAAPDPLGGGAASGASAIPPVSAANFGVLRFPARPTGRRSLCVDPAGAIHDSLIGNARLNGSTRAPAVGMQRATWCGSNRTTCASSSTR